MPGQPKHLVLEFNVGTVVPWPIRRPMVGEHGRSEGRKSRGLLPVSPSYALSGERALYWRRWTLMFMQRVAPPQSETAANVTN